MVYTVPCFDCNSVYIGQTGKSLSYRVKQHKYACRTLNFQNSIAKHSFDNDHRINWNESSVLKYCKDFVKRNIIESIYIANKNNFNNSLGMFKLDNFILNTLKTFIK